MLYIQLYTQTIIFNAFVFVGELGAGAKYIKIDREKDGYSEREGERALKNNNKKVKPEHIYFVNELISENKTRRVKEGKKARPPKGR